jgi:hypothetical protein
MIRLESLKAAHVEGTICENVKVKLNHIEDPRILEIPRM